MKFKYRTSSISILTLLACTSVASAAFPVGDPPDVNHPWGVHDLNRPHPPIVTPGASIGDAPSDAVVLFDGTETSLQNWVHVKSEDERKGDWIVEDGALLCVPGAGYIATKEHFGDSQLHVEWMAPPVIDSKKGQERGNSGVFFMGQIEVQVLDNYNNPSYADGMAGAVYAVMPPAANALRGPGEWQSYDIIFRRPIVKDGVTLDEGSMTVLVNGVVVQDSTPLDGGGGYKKRKPVNHPYPEVGPLTLQDHGDPVRYRNIWYRPLRPRPTDGGTEGRLSEAATAVKRAEIAADVRARAANQKGFQQMQTLLEAYLYDDAPEAWQECDRLVMAFAKNAKSLSGDSLAATQQDILKLLKNLKYLQKFNLIPSNYQPTEDLNTIAEAQGWLKEDK